MRRWIVISQAHGRASHHLPDRFKQMAFAASSFAPNKQALAGPVARADTPQERKQLRIGSGDEVVEGRRLYEMNI